MCVKHNIICEKKGGLCVECVYSWMIMSDLYWLNSLKKSQLIEVKKYLRAGVTKKGKENQAVRFEF